MGRLLTHLQVLGRVLRRMVAQPMATLLNILTIGTALALPLGGYLLVENARQVAERFGSSPQVSVFTVANAERAAVENLRKQLQALPAVKDVKLIARDEALGELAKATGIADPLAGLGQNPLPDTLVVTPKDAKPEAVAELVEMVKKLPAVAEVQFDSAWVDRLDRLVAAGRILLLGAGALLASAVIAVVFNTIRMQAMTLRDEVTVSLLFGATPAYVRRPFLYYGTLLGIGGALLALGLITALRLSVGRELEPLVAGLGLGASPLTIADAASLLAFAALLGWLGAWWSLQQHLAREG